MESHLKFRVGDQNKFIIRVLQKSNLNIDNIAKIVQTSPRNFRDWKREKYAISKMAVIKLSNLYKIKIPEKVDALEKRWGQYKKINGSIGGMAFKKLYGNPATPEGRRKGGSNALKIMRERGIIPQIKTFKKPGHSNKLAEFVGIMLGDGGITDLHIAITLNRVADSYYIVYVQNLCNSLFGEYPKILHRKNCLADRKSVV